MFKIWASPYISFSLFSFLNNKIIYCFLFVFLFNFCSKTLLIKCLCLEFYYCYYYYLLFRAVQKLLSSRLVMNSRWLWNQHQRHKFPRVKTSGDILKFRVLEMPFPWVFKRYFDRVAMLYREYTQDWERCRQNVPGVPQHHTVRTFHRSKPA